MKRKEIKSAQVILKWASGIYVSERKWYEKWGILGGQENEKRKKEASRWVVYGQGLLTGRAGSNRHAETRLKQVKNELHLALRSSGSLAVERSGHMIVQCRTAHQRVERRRKKKMALLHLRDKIN